MTRNELENMGKSEIVQIAKQYNVKRYKGKSLLPKEELIEGICRALEIKDDVLDAHKAIDEASEQHSDKSVTVDLTVKEQRIVSAPFGTLIAFREPETGKLNTAKLTNRNKVKKLVKCETQYGKEFTVPFENVVWTKTGSRWPKGIYDELKRKSADAKREKK